MSASKAELMDLAFDFWTEAADEHQAGKPSDCPACWKSYMATELWRHVTNTEVPINYYQNHQAAQFRLRAAQRRALRRAA